MNYYQKIADVSGAGSLTKKIRDYINFYCCPVNKKVYPLRGKVNFDYVDLQYFNPSADGRFSVEPVPIFIGKI